MKDEIKKLGSLLENAVKKNCTENVGAVYSAGIDSALVSLIASRFCDLTAYSVGTEGSPDLKYARRSMECFDFDIRVLEIDDGKVEEMLPDLLKIIGTCEPLQVSVGVPLYFASREAVKDGLSVMLSGQGADELFGGYNRYLAVAAEGDMEKLESAMRKDVENAYKDNLDRDIAIAKAFGIDLRFPYMDPDFSSHALRVHVGLKVFEVGDTGDYSCVDQVDGKKFIRKYLLRHLAAEAGVPKFILDRKKKAAQYGSETQKMVERIARRNGFKKKALSHGRPDHVRMYLESLV
ncbi:MAG: asparagine synthetase B [Candidatus Altiarchaeota archaeon]|nr:asparagine synthetase B [Candidatus Altiarchaeota archaeon]